MLLKKANFIGLVQDQTYVIDIKSFIFFYAFYFIKAIL